MTDNLPNSVRYVKNGAKGRWWNAARDNGQVHFGWASIPNDLLRKPDPTILRGMIKEGFGKSPGATADFNALWGALDAPSRHVWITFEDGYMWWCTVKNGVETNPTESDQRRGHFWLTCDEKWTNKSRNGRLLSIADLLGSITSTAGFKGTVCEPKAWEAILRLIRDEVDPAALDSAYARAKYEEAIEATVKRLTPKDFEELIDLILVRTGWARISTLGKTQEGIDLEVQNLAAGEIAFVQVKSACTQRVLNDYVDRFSKRRDRYARMIFAVHSPRSTLVAPADLPVQVWTAEHLSSLVVRLGLGEWVESRLS